MCSKIYFLNFTIYFKKHLRCKIAFFFFFYLVGCRQVSFHRNAGTDVMLVSYDTFRPGVLTTANFLAIIRTSSDVKEYDYERFFTCVTTYRFQNMNSGSDAGKTLMGTRSIYVGVYMVQHVPFYKSFMLRRTVNGIIDYNKYTRMFIMNACLAKLGYSVFSCFQCYDFYNMVNRSHRHIYDKPNFIPALPARVTENLVFVGTDFITRDFRERYNNAMLGLYGTVNYELIIQRYMPDLKARHIRDKTRAGIAYLKVDCGHIGYSHFKREIRINDALQLATKNDLESLRTANVNDFHIASKDELDARKEHFKLLSSV